MSIGGRMPTVRPRKHGHLNVQCSASSAVHPPLELSECSPRVTIFPDNVYPAPAGLNCFGDVTPDHHIRLALPWHPGPGAMTSDEILLQTECANLFYVRNVRELSVNLWKPRETA